MRPGRRVEGQRERRRRRADLDRQRGVGRCRPRLRRQLQPLDQQARRPGQRHAGAISRRRPAHRLRPTVPQRLALHPHQVRQRRRLVQGRGVRGWRPAASSAPAAPAGQGLQVHIRLLPAHRTAARRRCERDDLRVGQPGRQPLQAAERVPAVRQRQGGERRPRPQRLRQHRHQPHRLRFCRHHGRAEAGVGGGRRDGCGHLRCAVLPPRLRAGRDVHAAGAGHLQLAAAGGRRRLLAAFL